MRSTAEGRSHLRVDPGTFASLLDSGADAGYAELQDRVRVLEGRCQTYKERYAEVGGHLGELLAYTADAEAERAQSHRLLVALAEENAALQEALVRAERQRHEEVSEARERSSAEETLRAVEDLLVRSAPLTGVKEHGASLVHQVAELVALVVALRQAKLPAEADTHTPTATIRRAAPALATTATGLEPRRRGAPASAAHDDPTLGKLNEKIASLESAIKATAKYPRRR